VPSDEVELLETHISWVFRLEREVYKVKKPVDFGFLDFRTPEQRRAACEAEVNLNARLAPGVYLGVVPVRVGEDGRARVHGDGPTIDWAVRMMRLPDEHRADTLLRRGALAPEAIDVVAARLARFHATARCDEHTGVFGAPEAIWTNIEENFAQTAATLGDYLEPGLANELVRWQREFLHEHAPLFVSRAAGGRVRDGHGDLRLEHVYLSESLEPTIIDCIEFNERFRFADVCADVAFLSMDLAEHGRVDLAERLLARYAREADDYDLFALADFYESYRAFVRGKIHAIVAAAPGTDEAARARAKAEARRHFLLALSFDRRSLLAPAVVAVGGVIAAGKSTVAELVGDELGAPVIDSDRTRKGMLGAAPTQPVHEGAWRGAYDRSFTDRVYDEVLRRARVVLASGRPVVLDASFRSVGMRSAARALAVEFGVPFRLVECRCDPVVCRARLEERAKHASVSDGRLEIFDDFCKSFERIAELAPSEHLVVDTALPLETVADRLRAHLSTWPRGLVA